MGSPTIPHYPPLSPFFPTIPHSPLSSPLSPTLSLSSPLSPFLPHYPPLSPFFPTLPPSLSLSSPLSPTLPFLPHSLSLSSPLYPPLSPTLSLSMFACMQFDKCIIDSLYLYLICSTLTTWCPMLVRVGVVWSLPWGSHGPTHPPHVSLSPQASHPPLHSQLTALAWPHSLNLSNW